MATLNSNIITPIHTTTNNSIILPFHNLPSSLFTTASKKIDRISIRTIPTSNSNPVVSSKEDQPRVSHSATDIVRRFYSGINSRDLSLVVDLIAEDCVYEDLVFPQPIVGRKAILEFFEKFIYTISQDLQFAIDDISGEDTSAVGVTWHLEWKGKSFPFSKGCSFYRLEVLDGRRQIINIFVCCWF
uniref:uncharacterized protein LOC122588445 isoform X2 n=1 Tax=Erigeron canadensis TaxID=72917 RepID=UPI001CB8EC1E|nr:uncharacterized protein LOC122588445 isoform X2 [Erigeron canadensis]